MRLPFPPAQRGITLIELLFVLAIVALLCGISLPAMGNLIQSTYTRSARGDLQTSLNLARIQAVNVGDEVVVCPSMDRVSCNDDKFWQYGWIVFRDTNHDGERQPNEEIKQVDQGHYTGVNIASSSGRLRVVFRPDGSATGTNLTLTFCDRRGPSKASTLVVNNGGRIRLGKPTTAQIAAACVGV
jgi:type IV fimbrial biogenesis protein FimT